MLLRMTDIHKFYNGRQVLSHVSLTVEDHDRIGLVGVNGCGKSTLLRILTGQELPDHLLEGDGEIAKSAKTSIGYLEQMGGLDRESTVWAEMRSVFRPLLDTQERLHQLEEQMQSGDMYAHRGVPPPANLVRGQRRLSDRRENTHRPQRYGIRTGDL